MGLLFSRKKKPDPLPPEDLGTANIAKQVDAQTITVEHTDQPIIDAAIVRVDGTKTETAAQKAAEQKAAMRGAPIYEFESSLDPAKRSRTWYLSMAIFFAATVALTIVLRFYLSSVVLVLLALVLFTSATRKNKRLRVRFFSMGLALNEQFYPWREFTKFWVLYEPPALKQLHLQRRSRVINELSIDLANENPLKIRDMLLPLLPEDPTKEETRVDLVTRTFKL
jgi:hypothetical protein